MNGITIKKSDWLFNCGILGLYNILKHNNIDDSEDISLSQDELTFPVSRLENFEEKYFSYLIDTYEKTFSIHRITSFEDFLQNHEDSNFENFNTHSLDRLNSQIEQVKRYLKSNSYVSAYKMLDFGFDPIAKEKELKKVSLKKNETVFDKQSEIKKQMDILKETVEFFKRKEVRKYIGGKNAMYSIIKNAWSNISIMNPQNKNPDIYEEFSNYFVEPVKEYLDEIDSSRLKSKYRCVTCNAKIKNLDIDLSFMREIGFDVNRKTSHVWDFNNYVAICPVCRLVYACVPAGFTYLYNRGIFVNSSMDLQEIVRINQIIKKDVLQSSEGGTVIYRALQKQMSRKINETPGYELSDVQVIRFSHDQDSDNVSYTFNIITKFILKTIENCDKCFERIQNGRLSEGNATMYLYDEVMNRLVNNENQFLLIHKLIHYKLSIPDKAMYSMSTIENILKINAEYLREVGVMEKDDKNMIRIAKSHGYYLRDAYGDEKKDNSGNKADVKSNDISNETNVKAKGTGYNKKLGSIAYRMLNALKTNNKYAFMDTMINAHMYVQKPIPAIFAENLENDLKFKNIGYAFVTGMIGYTDEKKVDEKGNEEN